MVDVCEVRRGSGETVFDPETGQYGTAGTLSYTGRCKVQSTQSQASTPEAGGAVFTVVGSQVHVPVGTDIRDGDVVKITESALSPSLVGVELRVQGFIPDTWDTAHRAPVKVNT
jgi:hypothetical protein